MEVIIVKNSQAVAQYATYLISLLLHYKPAAVLGLATGTTPVPTYQHLIKLNQQGELSFKDVTTFNLDEYIGLEADSPHSYRSFMNRELFDHININKQRTFLPECRPGADPRKVGPQYEQQIVTSGGIDLQLLGIGSNGHIGFNEPSSSLGSRTRVKTLTKRTIDDNSRLFAEGEFQPHMAITMGIATILDARRILLMATGSHKATAIQQAIEGPISAMQPATALQHHQRVRVIIDEDAAAGLRHREYYRWVHSQNESITEEHGGSANVDPWFYS